MTYDLIKALHIIAVVSFMAGMLYLPRLFAYHAGVPVASEQDALFKVMEKRLLRIIINPALIAMVVFGVWLLVLNSAIVALPWFHAKAGLVVLMLAFHGLCAHWRKQLERGERRHSVKFFRAVNEIPAVLMAVIVLLVILKPF